jgi:hypothetical protein
MRCLGAGTYNTIALVDFELVALMNFENICGCLLYMCGSRAPPRFVFNTDSVKTPNALYKGDTGIY